jgi:hypothetical protein
MYERVFKERKAKNELVTHHAPEVGNWVLVRHEKHLKMERKLFGGLLDHSAQTAWNVPSSKS